MVENYVISINEKCFTLSDGRVFDFPFELDSQDVPTLEEFNKIYEKWKAVINIESKLEEYYEQINNNNRSE
jgi:hypothetical protein